MAKHVAFWIGFLTAATTVVLIAMGAWGIATEQALNLVALMFGATLALSITLLALFLFRGLVLKRLINSAEVSIESLADQVIGLVDASSKGDKTSALEHSRVLSRSALSWYAWNNFYRWIIGTNIALLIAFGGFAGTVLLFEQNRRLGEQTNELVAQKEQLIRQNLAIEIQSDIAKLAFVSEIRNRLVQNQAQQLAANGRGAEILPIKPGEYDFGPCHLEVVGLNLLDFKNRSSIKSVAALARSETVGESVIDALIILLSDQESSVALSAFLVLDELGTVPTDWPMQSIVLEDVLISELEIKSPVYLRAENSILEHVYCPKCYVDLGASVVLGGYIGNYGYVADSVISVGHESDNDYAIQSARISGVSNSLLHGIFSVLISSIVESSMPHAWIDDGPMTRNEFNGDGQMFLDDIVNPIRSYGELSYCEELRDFASIQPLLTFIKRGKSD